MLQKSSESNPADGIKEEEDQREMFGDQRWSSEKISTLDCLRKRLLSERTTSKAAKEDADFMEKKLMELERQLKTETESKNRAEKKLKFAMKKLESMKFPSPLGQPNSSENGNSCSPSNTQVTETTSCKTEEKGEVNQPISQGCGFNNAETLDCTLVYQMTSHEDSSDSMDPAHSDVGEDYSKDETGELKGCLKSLDSTNYDRRSSHSGEDLDQGKYQFENVDRSLALVQVEEHTESVDNSRALIPTSMWPDSMACGLQTSNIHDVLIALQHAKEHLHSSMWRRAAV